MKSRKLAPIDKELTSEILKIISNIGKMLIAKLMKSW